MTSRRRPAHSHSQTTHTLGMRDVGHFLSRGALFAIALAAVAAAAAYMLTRGSAPVYQATVSLVATQPGQNYNSLGLMAPSPVDPGVYQTALTQSSIPRETLQQIQGKAPTTAAVRRFENQIHVAVHKQNVSSTVDISVDSTNPQFASGAANTLAANLVAWDQNRARQSVQDTINSLQQSIARIDRQLNGAGSGAAGGSDRQSLLRLRSQRQKQLANAQATAQSSVAIGLIQPVSSATPPTTPIGPSMTFKLVVAGLLGLLVGYGFAFFRFVLDPRVRGRDDVVELTDLPVLAEFPTRGRGNGHISSEAANFLRSNLMQVAHGEPPHVIAVSSPRTNREKASVAVSLAQSLARAQYRVLLVDADLRRPSTTYGLDVSEVESPPLEVYLENPTQQHAPVRIAVGGRRAFDFIPSFTSAQFPVELLNRGFRRLLDMWRERYEYIVVDCPPVIPVADTLSIAPACTGLVLCTSLTESTRRDTIDSLERLEQIDVPVLGSVLTNARVPRRDVDVARLRATNVPSRKPLDPYRNLQEPGMRNVQVTDRNHRSRGG